jgi:hypothetical protein
MVIAHDEDKRRMAEEINARTEAIVLIDNLNLQLADERQRRATLEEEAAGRQPPQASRTFAEIAGGPSLKEAYPKVGATPVRPSDQKRRRQSSPKTPTPAGPTPPAETSLQGQLDASMEVNEDDEDETGLHLPPNPRDAPAGSGKAP